MNRMIVLPMEFDTDVLKITIYPTLLQDDDGISLVDCGYPSFLPKIETEFAMRGLQMKDLKHVILTHHDHDHMGAIRAIVTKYPEVQVFCSQKQAPYVTGEKKSLRLEWIEELSRRFTEQERVENKGFIHMIQSVEKLKLINLVTDGEVLPICGGVRVIDTSGHMPGHLSLYIPEKKALVAGDALVVENGRLCIAEPGFVLDKEQAVKSIWKLVELDLELEEIICYHGGLYKSSNIKDELRQIAETGYRE